MRGPMESFVTSHNDQNTAMLFRSTFNGQDYMFRHIPLTHKAGVSKGTSNKQISALVYFSIEQALEPYFAAALALSSLMALGLGIAYWWKPGHCQQRNQTPARFSSRKPTYC